MLRRELAVSFGALVRRSLPFAIRLTALPTVLSATAILLAGSCETLNPGGKLPGWGPVVTIGPGPNAAAHFDGEMFTWTASWTSGTPPYTVSWAFGADFDPAQAETITNGFSDAQAVRLANNVGASGTIHLLVEDSNGLIGEDTAAYAYGIGEAWNDPMLTVIDGDGTAQITIHAFDADGGSLWVVASPPEGFTTGPPQSVASGGDVVFSFICEDILAGGSGIANFVGYDITDRYDEVTATVTQAPILLDPDRLYAIPLVSETAAGDRVTIVVATGVPASPFRYLNGCRVTAPNGFAYESQSFNVGIPDGNAGAADGFWEPMGPSGGFLLAPDSFIREYDLGGGLTGISFNVTPIGGADQTASSGALFNFEATLAPGLNVLGFQQISTDGIKRTYYSDSTATECFWGDISNNHTGVPNSVTVE